MTAITGSVKDVTGVEDNDTPWSFASVIRFAEDGSVITEKPREVRAVSGNLKVNLVPGYAIVTYGKHVWQVDVPDTPTTLKALIEAGVAFPPDTAQALLDAAVGQYVEANREQFRTRAVPITTGPDAGKLQWYDENGAEVGGPSEAWTVTTIPVDAVSDAEAAGKDVVRSATPADVRDVINAHPLLPQGYFTAADKADGALTTLDSGQSWSVFGDTPGEISGGKVVHTPAVSGSSTAAYYQSPAGSSRPTRILCKGYWSGSGGNDNAALTLVVPISAWGPPGGFPANNAAQVVAGVHSTFFRNGIHKHSRWNVGSQTVYGDSEAAAGSNPALGRYKPVAVGESVWFELWIDYDTGTLTFYPPKGGKPFIVQDDAIKNDTGNWVVWEQFEYLGTDAGAPFVIEEMHFDTQVRRRDSFAATKLDIADLYPGLAAASAEGVESTTATGDTKVLTADSPRLQVFTTGTTAHTVQLPAALNSIQPMYVQNAITGGQLTIKDSTGATMLALTTGQLCLLIPMSLTPTVVGNWLYIPVVSAIGTQTLSATRVNPRVSSSASSASLSPNFSTADVFKRTAQAEALTINAPGNTTDSHRGTLWIKDDGTSRALTWNAAYVAMPGVTLPTATTVGKWLLVEYRYNSTASQAFVTEALIQP